MSSVLIYEPELMSQRGFNGFYRHFLSALVDCVGAKGTDTPRPLPRLTKPREHESCWTRWGEHWVFFDMSDHVQLFDVDALQLCSVYFKANLNRAVAGRILQEHDVTDCEPKLAPFLFFSEGLDDFMRDGRSRRFWRLDRPKYDLCFVMGVYENLVRDGGKSPFVFAEEPITSASYHFWIRWHIMQALQEAEIPGFYRLTSRANRVLEDKVTVHMNLSRRKFSRCISDGRMTMVCTLPHALFPWKASESFVLGRPIVIEQAPLTETPEPFMPVAGLHYLELLPETGAFNQNVPLTEAVSHRVLSRIPLDRFRERAEWLRGVLSDRQRMVEMSVACLEFSKRAYHKTTVAEYISDEVHRRIGS
ncbi:hypothetical protein [Desulfobulbus alkaliphilus]|uniref:hypothetical protein n=1 Tax=Desulfobulbus alkaliphilus TaxID=869814 RepID=UPI001965911E|nr:hypothetical protein [Desulfobulbus alkaliphilus]MBM9538191.1 hypothetical protein [Desulfobulbus alkaliphilus]